MILFSSTFTNGLAQNVITKSGKLEIYSETALFNMYGINTKVASILNPKNGEIIISTLIRSFRFKEAIVEEHFVEKYINPNQFPKAIFKGEIQDIQHLPLYQDGQFPVIISGTLSFHNIIQEISENGTLFVHNGQLSLALNFELSLKDYNVVLGTLHSSTVNNKINIKAQFNYVPKNY